MAQQDGCPKNSELPFMVGGIIVMIVAAIVGFILVLTQR
jgi:hypothetical protein